MTSYGPVTPVLPTWRKAVPLVVAAVGTPAAGVTALFAAIVYSGCFLSCTGGDHTSGALLWLLAGAFLLAGPVSAALLTRSWRWPLAAVGSGVLSCLVLTSGSWLA